MSIAQLSGKGTVHAFLFTTRDQLGKARELLVSLPTGEQKEHYTEFCSVLESITTELSKIEPDNYIRAMRLLMKAAKSSELTYEVAQLERNVEFKSGLAEGFRYCIQTMANNIENAFLYSVHGPDRDPYQDYRTDLESIKSEFHMSPFSYDHMFTEIEQARLMMSPFPFKFERRDRRSLSIGERLHWS